jgi:hypothetical protein
MTAPIPGVTGGMLRSVIPMKVAKEIRHQWALILEVPARMGCWIWLGMCGSGREACGAIILTLALPKRGKDARTYKRPMIKPEHCGAARSSATAGL